MKTLMKYSLLLASCVVLSAQASVNVLMHSTTQSGVGEGIGHVTLQDTPYGLLIVPDLQGLPPGAHGFHIHENANCGDAGKDAGGHLDPAKTGQHLGPYNDKGHLGDLPVLVVDDQGSATLPVLAPRLHLKDVEGRSLMIHDGSDNYSDVPNPLGGGGARIACGIIP